MANAIATYTVQTEADKDSYGPLFQWIKPLHTLQTELHFVCGTDINFVMPVCTTGTDWNRWWNQEASSTDGKWQFKRTSSESKLKIGDVIYVYPAIELPEPKT